MKKESVKGCIGELLRLERPEYVTQPESLLLDLLWRSKGSNLVDLVLADADKRLVAKLPHGTAPGVCETLPIAEQLNISKLVEVPGDAASPVQALLRSCLAPAARGVKTRAYVMLHPDVAALQTLHGLVNKSRPPNLGKIIETTGELGGSGAQGLVAALLIQLLSQRSRSTEGLSGFMDNVFPMVAEKTWAQIFSTPTPPGTTVGTAKYSWPGVSAKASIASEPSTFAERYKARTPFGWFWNKWEVLCNPANEWSDALPTRRFSDWATCILRTGLAFGYLWEASFFAQLYDCLEERRLALRGEPVSSRALDTLRSTLAEGSTLAAFESLFVPAAQKHMWNALHELITKGYLTRDRFIHWLEDEDPSLTALTDERAGLDDFVLELLDYVQETDIEKLAGQLEFKRETAKSTKEFVRYLLLPRSADDDRADQADLYYLARANNKGDRMWFQPGPEWLVVVTSLLGRRPKGRCTLGQLLEDLKMLGVRVERRVLVNMLEEAGLTTDSPDADNALVIKPGF